MNSNRILFTGKKAFTLLEVVISITIFMIILVFMYKTLDDTELSNSKFESHINKKDEINHLYNIFTEDIAESKGKIDFLQDRDKNSMVMFKSNNSFHNAFYSNITYMISSNNHLVRIESKDKFQKEKSSIEFYNSSFIDILLKDIEKFIVLQKDDKVLFIVKQKDKEKIVFSTFSMEN
ncbi:type II secretion system protein J [Arcobacter sp. LA11]|uniref:PulJ/GspJ family protein n=1 Tax=Arcobacter sp. LA11 TaxID=1898176 RepID=UPI00093426CA|nr:prepilin-type N-terminal cleavage/methylation domain-containing protein [Arcobacter sp. LA11]